MPASRSIALLSMLALLTLVSSAPAQTIRTVRAAGPGAAPPWDTAVTTLQVALAVAQAGDEIWIAEGTYTPTATTGFAVPSNVRMYGGFAGTEINRSDRSGNTAAHATVLTKGTAFHTLYMNNTGPFTLVDRVSIRGPGTYVLNTGNADILGTGLYAANSTVIMSDCSFAGSSGNTYTEPLVRYTGGAAGGSAYLLNCNSQLTRCVFSGSSTGSGGSSCASGTSFDASPGGKGGAAFISGGTAKFIGCTFTGNRTGSGGNGAWCLSTGATNGSAAGDGGAIYSTGASLSISRCLFQNNTTGNGSRPGISPSFIAGLTHQGGNGGAIAMTSGTLTLDSCTFVGNQTGNGAQGVDPSVRGSPGGSGGAIFTNLTTSVTVVNSLFVGNRTGNGGGSPSTQPGAGGGTGAALFGSGATNAVVANCTIASNTCGTSGSGSVPGPIGIGGLAGNFSSVTNSVLWGNSGAQYAGSPTLRNNCVQSNPPGTGGTNADPRFVNAATGDYRLQASSPCIDTGSSDAFSLPPEFDLDGHPRFVSTCGALLAVPTSRAAIDIGAYEYQSASTDCNADGICDALEVSGIAALTPFSPQTGQQFGWSLAMTADAIAIGSRGKVTGAGIGSGDVTLYDRATGYLGSPRTLIAPDGVPGDDFGNQVALSDRFVIVGARFADVGTQQDAGAAYIFRRDGASFPLVQRLIASDGHAGDEFAHGLATDGTRIVSGSLRADANVFHTGAAYVFRLGSAGTFTQEAKLTASDAASGDGLGISVGISGSTIVAGAPYRTELGINSGAAYIFELSGSGWTQTAKLLAPGAQPGETYGELVAISADTIAINAPRRTIAGRANAGAVFVYQRTAGVWQLATTLTSNDPRANELFGFGLSLQGNTLAIGGFSRGRGQAGRSGCAYIFKSTPTGWRLASRIETPEPENDAFFGYALALSGGNVLIGSPQQTARATPAVGAARLYDLALLDSNFNNIPDSCEIAAGTLLDADHDGIPDTIPANSCFADFNASGTLSAQDIFDYLGAWFASDPRADFDSSGTITISDIFAFLNAWFLGC